MNHQLVLTFLKYEGVSQLNSVGPLCSEVFSAVRAARTKGVAENDQLNGAQFKAHAMHRLRSGHTADSRVPPAVVSQLGAEVASHSDASLHSPARGRMCNGRVGKVSAMALLNPKRIMMLGFLSTDCTWCHPAILVEEREIQIQIDHPHLIGKRSNCT